MMTELFAQIPDNLVVEGIPAFPPELQKDAARYMEFRAAAFQSWHPSRREMLITTRFAESMQLHHVKFPGGARRQITFLPEPVAGAQYQPKKGECIVFAQDAGGGEFYQLYRYDLSDSRITLLTDGKSRNTGARWSRSGQWLAYTSTKRTGRDNDVWLIEPQRPSTAKLLHEVSGGGWSVQDWSRDESKLLVAEYVSINQSHLHLIDVKTGQRSEITSRAGGK